MDNVPLPKVGRLWRSKADFFRPFRNATTDVGENISPLFDPELHARPPDTPDLRDLNQSLAVLVEVFPDVDAEVFREMLAHLSDQSRVEVVTEHMLREKDEQVRTRWKKLRRPSTAKLVKTRTTSAPRVLQYNTDLGLPVEETFRSSEYKQAVKLVCYNEFKNLSHSAIRAVMAEQNHSYTLARPILQQLSSSSWRFSFNNLWSRRTLSSSQLEHPNVLWQASGSSNQSAVPSLKRTGSAELDHELHFLLIEPVLSKLRRDLLAADHKYASQINETEAESAAALFDCECCFGSVPFENLATCNDGAHQLCFDCVRRTVSEALYGQGWLKTADLERSTVRCFAPSAAACHGSLPGHLVRRARAAGTESVEMWEKLQDRVAADVLTKSEVPLLRCPFCSYAEVAEVPELTIRNANDIWLHFASRAPVTVLCTILLLLLGIFVCLPVLVLIASILRLLFHFFPPFTRVLQASWTRTYKGRRGLKFYCRAASCARTSCTRCLAAWRDPHACFENERTSLRTALEASATSAVKRTCPRCLLSFVKASGCNKLVCNCGYTMCYICRNEITAKEGYGHFCQHFRPHGGTCDSCDRCELYGDEDEAAVIRKAVEGAERTWKETEGGKVVGDQRATSAMVEALVGGLRGGRWWERTLDWVMDAVAV